MESSESKKDLVQIPGEFTGYKTMAGGTRVRLYFDTADKTVMDPAAMGHFMSILNKEGWLTFRSGEEKLSEKELPDIPQIDHEAGEKETTSQRLRRYAFKLHMIRGGKKEDFNNKFQEYKERECQKFLELIDEHE